MMRAGSFRQRLKIKEPTTVTSDDGTSTTIYTDATNGTVWASVEPLRGRELIEAQQQNADLTHRIRMRYWPGLTERHRLEDVEDGAVYELFHKPLDIEHRHIEVELMCGEVTTTRA